MHPTQNVSHRRLALGTELVVGKSNYLLVLILKRLDQVLRHAANVADTLPKLSTLSEIVDADEESSLTVQWPAKLRPKIAVRITLATLVFWNQLEIPGSAV